MGKFSLKIIVRNSVTVIILGIILTCIFNLTVFLFLAFLSYIHLIGFLLDLNIKDSCWLKQLITWKKNQLLVQAVIAHMNSIRLTVEFIIEKQHNRFTFLNVLVTCTMCFGTFVYDLIIYLSCTHTHTHTHTHTQSCILIQITTSV